MPCGNGIRLSRLPYFGVGQGSRGAALGLPGGTGFLRRRPLLIEPEQPAQDFIIFQQARAPVAALTMGFTVEARQPPGGGGRQSPCGVGAGVFAVGGAGQAPISGLQDPRGSTDHGHCFDGLIRKD